jgi:hypothetical protein
MEVVRSEFPIAWKFQIRVKQPLKYNIVRIQRLSNKTRSQTHATQLIRTTINNFHHRMQTPSSVCQPDRYGIHGHNKSLAKKLKLVSFDPTFTP